MWITGYMNMLLAMEFCSDHSIPKNITELRHRLQTELIGQPLAHDIVLNAISSHIAAKSPSKALVLSLHGTTGTGKTFVSQHIVESLYRRGSLSQFIKFYTSRDFMHSDEEHLRRYKDRLKNDIESTTKICPYATFIFDEINLMPKQLFDVITPYLEFYHPTATQPIDFRRTIFIFISNTGGESILELTAQFHHQSIPREKYPLLSFQTLLSNVSYNEDGGLWHTHLITESLITFFVPFLPLEREHIRQCVERQIQRILDEEIDLYEIPKKKMIDQVLDQIEFKSIKTRSSSFTYSLSGCKTVQQKTRFVFEMLRSTMTKTGRRSDQLDDL